MKFWHNSRYELLINYLRNFYMIDLKSLFVKAVEDKALNVSEYIFMPERVDMMVHDGKLSCVLNSDGKVNVIYQKKGITEARTGLRKSPFTSFRNELHYGVYDDLVEEAIEAVEKITSQRSKYFSFINEEITVS